MFSLQLTLHERLAYVGDTLTLESRVTDVVQKKGGALTLMNVTTRVTNQRGEHVADIRKSLVHRNG